MIDEALPILLRQANSQLSGAFSLQGDFSMRERMRVLDIFECMIRVDNVASSESLSGVNRNLDAWALSEPEGLVSRLTKAPKSLTLATFLTVSPRGLGCLADHFSLYRWIEFARAVNRVSPSQAQALRDDRKLENYLCGSRELEIPRLDLPLVLPIPVPSALRVVQNFRFRKGLLKDAGYQEAMRRYVRLFC